MMKCFGTVKDRVVELFIGILKRGYSIVFILDNIIKGNYKKECILWFKILGEN